MRRWAEVVAQHGLIEVMRRLVRELRMDSDFEGLVARLVERTPATDL